jgi:hypothetical protein
VFLMGVTPSHLGGCVRWYAMEGRALCASETLYSMDAVAKAPWMGLRCVFCSTNKQSGLLNEAVVEAHVRPSTAWMLLQRPHGWVYAVTFTLPTTACCVDRSASRSPCETLSSMDGFTRVSDEINHYLSMMTCL